MKSNIHPNWNHQALVTCSCGSTFTTGSMQDTLNVDICSKCHPFFTGEMKFVDRQGRVDKFMQKMQAAQVKQQELKSKKKKAAKADAKSHLTYKQLLQQQQTAISAVKKATATKMEEAKTEEVKSEEK